MGVTAVPLPTLTIIWWHWWRLCWSPTFSNMQVAPCCPGADRKERDRTRHASMAPCARSPCPILAPHPSAGTYAFSFHFPVLFRPLLNTGSRKGPTFCQRYLRHYIYSISTFSHRLDSSNEQQKTARKGYAYVTDSSSALHECAAGHAVIGSPV